MEKQEEIHSDFLPSISLGEHDVGITEYFNKDNKGFSCIIKHRYTDFLVNEVNTKGEVLWGERPKPYVYEPVKEQANSAYISQENKKEEAHEVDLSKFEVLFSGLLGEADLDKLKKFIEDYSTNFLNTNQIFVSLIEDKAYRKDFHEKIRNNFPFLDSSTDIENKRMKVQLIKNTVNKRRPKVSDDKPWDPNVKKYLIATLLKRNVDTMFAVNYIAKFLHKSFKTISFAGNKDKRGVTVQNISLFNCKKEEVEKATVCRNWDRRIELTGLHYSDKEYGLGFLNGNQFSVVLRFIDKSVSNDEVGLGVESLKKGFINYFGMQRFGSGNSPTHLIGKEALKGNWKKAISMILKGNYLSEAINDAGLQKDIKSIDHLISSEFFVKAILSKMNRRAHTENSILQSLRNCITNYGNAFKSLSRQLRLLYVHAYQSYIWNKAISYRFAKYDHNLVIGDIVLKDTADDLKENVDELEDDAVEEESIPNTDIFTFVTEENISNYTINDLYLPLIGKGIILPKNDIGEYVASLIAEDGIKMTDQLMGTGAYRKVVRSPEHVKWEILHHDDTECELQNEYYNKESHPMNLGEKHRSLRLQFQVPQSTYATMVFRELTKVSSAFNIQADLTEKVQKNNEICLENEELAIN